MKSCSDIHFKLNAFRCYEKYCDVSIRVQNEDFPCHRVLLASASEYFDAMFGGSFIESTAQEITLHDIDAKTFKEIVTLVYEGQECNISVKNVISLLHASLFLRIPSIENTCVEFILKNVSTIQDHIEIFSLLRAINNTALIDTLSVYIIRNFKLFYNDERFLEMPFDDLKLILDKWSHDQIPFKHENLLLDLLIRWVHHDPNGRRKYFKEFVSVVDFERISAEYITFMLKYFENLETSTENVACMIEEKKSNCDSSVKKYCNIEDSKNRLLLKRKVSEYFATNEKFSDNGENMIPVAIHQNPNSFKNILGLHVYIEYEPYFPTFIGRDDQTLEKRVKKAKILSINKYQPDWFVSCETDAWYRCTKRHIIAPQTPLDSAELLYSFETFQDKMSEDNTEDFRETFCAYPSIDLSLPTSVLTPPPITLNDKFATCAVRGDIYLLYQIPCYGSIKPLAHNTFSQEELDRGLCRYNCEVDKWFPVPLRKIKQQYPCLAVDNHLIYSIESDYTSSTVQAFDYRSSEWIILQNCLFKHNLYYSQSCTVNDRIYLSSEYEIETFDPTAGRWQGLHSPELPTNEDSYFASVHMKLLAYENTLWLIGGPKDSSFQPTYSIATYNFSSQEWYVSESLHKGIQHSMLEKMKNDSFFNWKIQDAIVFKSV